MRKKFRWVFIVLLTLLVISIGVVVGLGLWADRIMVGPPRRIKAYTHILETLPTPPGWQSQTDHLWLSSGAVDAYRDYEVAEPYEQVLQFFETELPQPGWSLLKREQRNQMTSLLFRSEEHYCISISISERMTTDEAERAYVFIELREEPSRDRCEF